MCLLNFVSILVLFIPRPNLKIYFDFMVISQRTVWHLYDEFGTRRKIVIRKMNTRTNMSSILLESRTESEPSVASQIHDCTRELMDATNVIDFRAKECVEIVRAAVDANVSKVEMAKKDVNEKRKREVENSACKIKVEGTNLEVIQEGFVPLYFSFVGCNS